MKKILIIDDEQDMLDMLRYCLEAMHYQVITATNGIEGFAKTVDEKPDLILLDIMMPTFDGCSLLQEFRWKHELQAIPIIVYSGLEHLEERVREEKVVKDFFVKPFHTYGIVNRIQELVGDGR